MTMNQSGSPYKFKEITVVPKAKDFVDIILSKTQRKTPTEVHPGFKISRIRSFYMRKVKFAMQSFHERLSLILTEFPRLDDIHPFYADLCNVLYDRDHYKLALGQINAVRGVIDGCAKDYVRLMKYGDSPYKLKLLKRAALGRMCTAIKKLQASLTYLEEVRQHLARLPSINPNTRTLILTGYPNVGKSSFMNTVSNANVEVQPYAFTTKSLYVGHFDFDYTRWQIIDTPGILDRPLDARNTTEMQAITALAHIQATVMYFVDISEQCGWTIEQQVTLFHSIKPLFKTKPVLILLNKTDVRKFETLTEAEKEVIKSMADDMDSIEFLPTSCITTDGVDAAKHKACEFLLARRVQTKVETKKVDTIANRLHITNVVPRSDRPPSIPESVLKQAQMEGAREFTGSKKVDKRSRVGGSSGMKTEKDLEEENGGAGVHSVDLRKTWMLTEDDWKYDTIPEIFEGKNVADFIDPDIDAKLRELEKEEELLLAEDAMVDYDDADWDHTQKVLNELHHRIDQKRLENRLRKARTKTPVPRKKGASADEVESHLESLGYDSSKVVEQRSRTRGRTLTREEDPHNPAERASQVHCAPNGKRKRSMSKGTMEVDKPQARTTKDTEGMDIDSGSRAPAAKRIRSSSAHHRSLSRSKADLSLPRSQDRKAAEKKKWVRAEKHMVLSARKGEADRFIGTAMPKHLYSGKRGNGKTDRR